MTDQDTMPAQDTLIPQDTLLAPPTLRGFYTWGGSETVPVSDTARAKLRYKRFTMRDLWPERTRFDWSPLDAELDRALRNGQQYALRLRAMSTDGIAIPDWAKPLSRESVTLDTNKPITVPNHDDPEWIKIMREFINSVAEHCNTRNPGLVTLVDIGMLGRWGEGHFWGIKGDGKVDGTQFWMPSVATQRAIVDAHIEAFGNTARLLCVTDPEDMLRYALSEAKSPQPIGWRRDSLGNASFDKISKNSDLATLLRDRAKIAPVMTEFFGPDNTDVALARQQAVRWNVWLVGNGNLGKDWKDLSSAEQNELLGLSADLAKAAPTPTPQPGPETKPPTDTSAQITEMTAQIRALQSKVEALTALVQAIDLKGLNNKLDALSGTLQTANIAGINGKLDALSGTLQTATVAGINGKLEALSGTLQTANVTGINGKLDALTAQIQQERRFVVETTVRELPQGDKNG